MTKKSTPAGDEAVCFVGAGAVTLLPSSGDIIIPTRLHATCKIPNSIPKQWLCPW
jgi:hypothetical protein